jgi:hypothetical protein
MLPTRTTVLLFLTGYGTLPVKYLPELVRDRLKKPR